MHNITCSHVQVTIVAGEAVHITYTECALVVQYTKCMHHISHLWPVWFYYHIFLHHLINGSIFEVIEHKMCLLIFFYNFCLQKFLILKIIQDAIINVHKSSCFINRFPKKNSNIKFH